MLRNLWQNSIGFRRVVAALSLGAAALITYLASNIPQSASLPNPDIDNLAVARTAERLRIYKPQIDSPGAVLSFEGAENVNAEVWVEDATLTGTSVRFAPLAPAGPTRAVYAQASDPRIHASKDCRTMLTISSADSGSAPQTLDLWQDGVSRDDQRYRMLIVSSPEPGLKVEVSTNAPPHSQATCPRLLTMGQTPIPIPDGPVDLQAPPNKGIKILFSSVDATVPLWAAKGATFDGLSLGDGTLKADSFEVISTGKPAPPVLHVAARDGTNGITLHDLKLGAEDVSLSAGKVTELADAWTNGKRLTVFDLVDKVQKNPVLGYLLAAVIIPGLWVWIRKTCFPAKPEGAKKD
jgi:hypothetical protein